MAEPDFVGSPAPSDERRQTPSQVGWSECHRLFAVCDGGKTAMAMQFGRHLTTARDTASFHCVVFRRDLQPVVIAENEIEVPPDRWEFRTSGLWVDSICETPYAHWSYGLEAFGLAIDEPTELLGRGYGDRVALGWELEFESTIDAARRLADGVVSQPGHCDGELLFGTGPQPFTGPAVRQHRWGAHDLASHPPVTGPGQRLLDIEVGVDHHGAMMQEVALPVPDLGIVWWVSWTTDGLRSRAEPHS